MSIRHLFTAIMSSELIPLGWSDVVEMASVYSSPGEIQAFLDFVTSTTNRQLDRRGSYWNLATLASLAWSFGNGHFARYNSIPILHAFSPMANLLPPHPPATSVRA